MAHSGAARRCAARRRGAIARSWSRRMRRSALTMKRRNVRLRLGGQAILAAGEMRGQRARGTSGRTRPCARGPAAAGAAARRRRRDRARTPGSCPDTPSGSSDRRRPLVRGSSPIDHAVPLTWAHRAMPSMVGTVVRLLDQSPGALRPGLRLLWRSAARAPPRSRSRARSSTAQTLARVAAGSTISSTNPPRPRAQREDAGPAQRRELGRVRAVAPRASGRELDRLLGSMTPIRAPGQQDLAVGAEVAQFITMRATTLAHGGGSRAGRSRRRTPRGAAPGGRRRAPARCRAGSLACRRGRAAARRSGSQRSTNQAPAPRRRRSRRRGGAAGWPRSRRSGGPPSPASPTTMLRAQRGASSSSSTGVDERRATARTSYAWRASSGSDLGPDRRPTAARRGSGREPPARSREVSQQRPDSRRRGRRPRAQVGHAVALVHARAAELVGAHGLAHDPLDDPPGRSRNIRASSPAMIVTSPSAADAAPPAHGPATTVICGTVARGLVRGRSPGRRAGRRPPAGGRRPCATHADAGAVGERDGALRSSPRRRRRAAAVRFRPAQA